MGERGGLGLRLMESDDHPRFQAPAPPLTAIERFLWSPNEYYSQKEAQQRTVKRQSSGGVSSNGFCELPSFHGAIHDGYRSGFRLGGMEDQNSFVDGLFVEGDRHLEWDFDKENQLRGINKKVGKKVKGGANSANNNLIKGQWTDEEDRLLVRLVQQHGVKKWAQIAQKLVGRAGKQCRERWHNHLRPDIKKDTWSEEEEKLLVEAHEKVGNKWAEIAKQIPGRTENSIKNHWNATKRRQNSKRKNKRAGSHGGKSHPCILQDYIRSKSTIISSSNTTSSSPKTTHTTLTITTTTASVSNNLYETSESSVTTDESMPLIAQIDHDEELQFIQSFFEPPSNGDHNMVVKGSSRVDDLQSHPLPLDCLDLSEFIDEHQLMIMEDQDYGVSLTADHHACPNNPSQYMCSSDLCISCFLNGVSSSSSSSSVPLMVDGSHESRDFYSANDQGNYYCGGKRDMDLMEMISCSQMSTKSNTATTS